MGAMSDAFGMSTLSIATLNGYFATEIGTMHGLGSALFVAILAAGIISKEEDAHTGEFLFAMPVSRRKILLVKWMTVLSNIVLFTAICAALYVLGYLVQGAEIDGKHLALFLGLQMLMNVELAAVCFFLSAISRKNRFGVGMGIALLCYAFDLIARVVPDVKKIIGIGPFSYCNASEIFAGFEVEPGYIVWAVILSLATIVMAFVSFEKRDLAA